MNWLIGVIGVGAAVLLALMLWWFFQGIERFASPFHTSAKKREAGYSVWSYQSASWSLQEDRSAPGHLPGQPPVEAGLFDGYCVRVTSVQRAEARSP
jgi:hypothetical protein